MQLVLVCSTYSFQCIPHEKGQKCNPYSLITDVYSGQRFQERVDVVY